MKQKRVLKAFTDLFLRLFERQTAKPTRAPKTPNPTGEQQFRQALLFIQAEENYAPRNIGIAD